MDVAGRIMDAIAEAPQSRRAKVSAAPTTEGGHAAGLSFAETLIGIVQSPSLFEPAKTGHEANATSDVMALPTEAPKSDAAGLSDTLLPNDGVATAALMVAAMPIADRAITNSSTASAPANMPPSGGQAALVPVSQPSAQTSLVTADQAVATPDTLESLKSQMGAAPTVETAEQTATASILAQKTQVAASQSLLAGLAALGQTQQPAADEAHMAQLIAKAAAPTLAQATPLNPVPTDATTALPVGPALELALAANPQGPGAARALEAQSVETHGLKTTGNGFSLTNGSGLLANDDSNVPSLAPSAAASTTGQQMTAVASAGLVPNLAKAATKADEPKIAGTDATGLLGGSSGVGDAAGTQIASLDGANTPAQDTAPKPSLVQPHTIPMLAAAMMRRISNGLKEFTLRLDPPELGRVDVRLTMGADKKVRAVVSTDRPEALKDLALSARDLTRALQEAGLDLEENGLSFSMNDQGSSQQNGDANRQHSARIKHSLDGYDTSETVSPEPAVPLATHLSGPVERWQRARIAITV